MYMYMHMYMYMFWRSGRVSRQLCVEERCRDITFCTHRSADWLPPLKIYFKLAKLLPSTSIPGSVLHPVRAIAARTRMMTTMSAKQNAYLSRDPISA